MYMVPNIAPAKAPTAPQINAMPIIPERRAAAASRAVVSEIMSMMALGAIRRGKIAPVLRWVFAGMFVFCAGCFCVALAIPANEGAGGPLLFNFPLRSTIVLLGVAIVPILVMPFAWALTFDSSMLSEADLQRLREAQRRMADGGRQTAEDS